AQLGPNGAFTDNKYADKHHLRVGSTVPLLTPGGKTLRLVIKGIIDPPTAGSPYGPLTFAAETFDTNYPQPTNQLTFVNMRGGFTPANTKRLEEALSAFPNAKVQDREEFKKNQISGVNTILNILYVLLALSVIVSLFGIVNTLALSVFERTRELGLLRAIGTTRRQVRQMIRQESVVTALIGAVLGIVLGVALGALLAARIEFIAFRVPVSTLILVAIAAIVVGILAAIMPARRASRLNVLEALQYE
ncbi:MAG TPA: FtsX-like permease family protein, partial [Gaiellaceae bacterium]|nr:FtsX-like permease family protein [Gaiellaceae bacterium]